jgi:hypothetical protein
MIHSELDRVLLRPRYGQRPATGGDGKAAAGVAGNLTIDVGAVIESAIDAAWGDVVVVGGDLLMQALSRMHQKPAMFSIYAETCKVEARRKGFIRTSTEIASMPFWALLPRPVRSPWARLTAGI